MHFDVQKDTKRDQFRDWLHNLSVLSAREVCLRCTENRSGRTELRLAVIQIGGTVRRAKFPAIPVWKTKRAERREEDRFIVGMVGVVVSTFQPCSNSWLEERPKIRS